MTARHCSACERVQSRCDPDLNPLRQGKGAAPRAMRLATAFHDFAELLYDLIRYAEAGNDHSCTFPRSILAVGTKVAVLFYLSLEDLLQKHPHMLAKRVSTVRILK
ncbi:hypothetical protein KC340_g153 [Hortaea werneckii]|nr:hypothetical protein KC340_g153 [Hortaea werneckii]